MMKNNKYFPNVMLTVVVALTLLVCRVIRTFGPMWVLPQLDIPNMVLLSLAALLLAHYLGKEQVRVDVWTVVMAVVTFGLLPFAAGFAELVAVPKLALAGGVVFAAETWLFGQMQERLSSGPAAKAAPVLSALGLYLAAQCFAGIIL